MVGYTPTMPFDIFKCARSNGLNGTRKREKYLNYRNKDDRYVIFGGKA